MRTVSNCQTMRTGVTRHEQIVRGITNHQRTFGRDGTVIHNLLQHEWVWLAPRFICRPRGIKILAQAAMPQCPV